MRESYVEDRPDLWNAEVWIRELEELKPFGPFPAHLLGQSWGGILLLEYLAIMSRKELKASFFQYAAGILDGPGADENGQIPAAGNAGRH
ncbi:MAG: hypothetical protein ACLVJO_13320 [[Clostridium] scindens]